LTALALILPLVLGAGLTSNKLGFGGTQTLTNALASLATSSDWTAGYESAVVDNSTDLYLDYEVWGQVTVGTTPTTATQIRVYVVPSFDGSGWPDVFDGSTGAETVTSAGVRDATAVLAKVIAVDSTTSNRAYTFSIPSIAQLFGGVVPAKFVLFTTHNTAVNLNSTGGNHTTSYRGVYSTNG
jgi:hypothetical protein